MSAPVLLDAHHLGLGATGNETWSRCVLAALEEDGGDPWDYAVPEAGRQLLPQIDPRRVHTVSSSSARRLLVDVPRLVRKFAPTAVVAQYTLPAVRVPGVVVVHDLSFESPQARQWLSWKSVLRYRATVRWSVRRAGAVVVPSQWTRDDLLRHYDVDGDRVLVAPCAVDPDLVAALERPASAIGTQRVVLAVGTVLPRKNLEVVARAVARMRASGDAVTLRLVGPVPQAGVATLGSLRTLLPEGLEVWGAVTAERVAEAYTSSSVMAFPSWYEGFGIPVLEAMVAGLPVVASNATCLPEVVGDAGLLVDPRDEAGWKQALADAMGSRAADLAEAGPRRARTFSWTTTASVVRRAVETAQGLERS